MSTATEQSAARESARAAIARIRSIHDAAENRSLTNAQERDYTTARASLLSSLQTLAPESRMLSDLSGHFERMRSILDKAAGDNRELTAQEDRILHEIDRTIDMEQRALVDHALRSALGSVIGVKGEGNRSFGKNTMQSELLDAFRTAAGGQSTTFEAHLSTPFLEERALGSSGGSAIPTTFYDRVNVYERTATPMLDPSIVTVLSTEAGEPITLPRLTADVSHGGTVTAEAAGISELDPTISSVDLGAFKYAVINLWSSELDLDNAIGIEDLMARSTGRELGLDIGTHLTTGTATTQPNGIVTAASLAGTAQGTSVTGGDTFFGWPDLADLMHSVAVPYQITGSFMMSQSAFTKVIKFRDTEGRPILDITSGSTPRLWGRPVYVNPAMASAASASKSVIFGDLKGYYVRRVTPARVELSKDYKFSTDQVALRVVERVDGNLLDEAAVRVLVSANT